MAVCRYCESPVSATAKKCAACGEWLQPQIPAWRRVLRDAFVVLLLGLVLAWLLAVLFAS